MTATENEQAVLIKRLSDALHAVTAQRDAAQLILTVLADGWKDVDWDDCDAAEFVDRCSFTVDAVEAGRAIAIAAWDAVPCETCGKPRGPQQYRDTVYCSECAAKRRPIAAAERGGA